MKVLVTGAGGFAGGYVARRLAELGADVVAVTRSSVIVLPDDPAAAARIQVLHADLSMPGVVLPATDVIVHAAATSIWDDISVDQMISDNVASMQVLVRHARACGARKFVFFSSFSAFGDIAADVVDEHTNSLNADAYGLTKLLGEEMLADVQDDIASLSIRLPAVIGPGSKRNWLSECVRKLKAGEPLSYVNPDALFNNACHIQDLAMLIHRWGIADQSGAQMTVVGAGGKMRVADIVSLLAARIKSASDISVGTRELRTFLIDSSRAQRQLGYEPMDIAVMLDRFVVENL